MNSLFSIKLIRNLNPKLKVNLFRMGLNLWPCIRHSGGKVVFLAEDFSKLTVRLPLTWKTRNIVGTIYGGSMCSATDPFFMLMLLEILGPEYVVWDKGDTIRFKRPAKETLTIDFLLPPERVNEVKAVVAEKNEGVFTWTIELKGPTGIVYAEIDKVLYVATKAHYKEKQKAREAKMATVTVTN